METLTHEIAAAAARLVVDEGLDYGAAKRRAGQQLGAPPRAALPGNDLVEAAVREHIAIFHANTQPRELAALRQLALAWMQRLAEFRPHLAGAVWNGTATRLSDIYLQLFCDDPKAVEIALIGRRANYQARTVSGFNGAPVEALSLSSPCPELGETVGVHLMIHDHDDLRGALKPRADGQSPRGDRQALLRRMAQEAQA
ncbi:MAG: hypothetical protein FWG56_01500 [Desulfovibrionaceae bacterium]|jgi:hypothetical protein|nr:hypothetical protein [Desulfovibrionaceae bacterium]